jgi:YegS/Rv2252/BmrU family lipid kinase
VARRVSTPIVVAVGGDGTASEVANGIIGSNKILGVIPCGSGNDFIKSVGVPPLLPHSLNVLLRGKTQRIDIGELLCKNTGLESGHERNSPARYFVNGVGIGFDAGVAERVNRGKCLKGNLSYLFAVFQTLRSYKPMIFEVSAEDVTWRSRNLLIAIGNGNCAGGRFYLTPEATPQDGLLDGCIIEDMAIPRILRLMPKVMKGSHGKSPGVHLFRGKNISVRSEGSFSVHADGEVVGRNVNAAVVRVRERALNVISGKP